MRPPVEDLGQPISVEAAPLDDCDKRLFRRLQQADVLQGIALDDEQVGDGIRPQATELALLAQYPRANQRRGPDDLRRRKDLATQDEFAALFYLKRAEQVRPVGDRHAGAFANLQRAK